MSIIINTKNRITAVSPLLYGIFFEDINYAGDGGLYGELLVNRSFDYYDKDKKSEAPHKIGWNDNIIVKQNRHGYHITLKKGEKAINNGFNGEGFAAYPGSKFIFSIRSAGNAVISVSILKNTEIIGNSEFEICSKALSDYDIEINTNTYFANSKLEINVISGSADIYYTSLFNSNSFKGHKNGMRKDIAEALEALSPKFMRFPGGCIVEGRSFDNMYNWKDTIGDVKQRRTNWNRWQLDEYQQEGRSSYDYYQSYGIGYYEYFRFCEDIGAEPVPVVNCGMTCQWHEALLAPLDEIDKWICDTVDLIEFANGDIDTKWGKKRAEMGHERPFNLKYIGIGNEQWGDVYFERYEAFEKVLSKKHPEIKLITSAGWTIRGDDYDTAVSWMKNNKDKAYAVDEHFYKEPEWFLENINRYDNFDRNMPKIFAGEYAAHSSTEVKDRKNNWYTALCEAAFLTGAEKNSDQVIMTCYAPLLAKKNHQQWQPNLIWFDNENVYLTPNYHIQKLFSNNIGKYYVENFCDNDNIKISTTTDGNKLYIKLVNTSEKTQSLSFDIDIAVNKIKITKITAKKEAEDVTPLIENASSLDSVNEIKGNTVMVLELN